MVEAILAAGFLGLGIFSSIHALLTKRDPRSTLVWTVLCALVPAVGATLYWTFGVSRIETKARTWQAHGRFSPVSGERTYGDAEATLASEYPARAEALSSLVRIAERVTRKPLLRGNRVEPLYNGEQAYPRMLEAIAGARKSVYLCTYIFDTDEAGMRFVHALGEASRRGVDVCVLVDGIGEWYMRPRVSKVLRRLYPGVKVARFLPPTLSLRGLRINLRNHRKLLTVDSRVAFTGGMNLGQRHMIGDPTNKHATADVHFRVTGPVVCALEDIFFEDWYFVTGQELAALPGSTSDPAGDPAGHHGADKDSPLRVIKPEPEQGQAMCRAISDGPNKDYKVLMWILVGALNAARESIQIMTPYFIPSPELLSALNAAALRGVKVEILLPAKNNLPFVAWATQAMLSDVLQYGVAVYVQPPPFNHSKLLIVDAFYILMGSANLDPRSLQLNFELNLEVYEITLAEELSRHFVSVRDRSHRITMDELSARNGFVKFRDSLARLLSPYL